MVKRNLLTNTTTLGMMSVLALTIGLPSSKGILPKAHAGEDSEKKECSLATLRGVYLFTSTEASPSDRPDPLKPFAAAGLRAFDGEGNISQVASFSQNGVITQHAVGTGTYTLDSDCTGTMTSAGRVHWDIFVATDGSEGVAVRTDDGNIGILTFKKP